MSQTKKDGRRVAILDAASMLFREQGYNAASLRAISQRSGVSLANVYIYFRSKLDILFTLYSPWFTDRMARLEREALTIDDPAQRLRFVVKTLLHDLPAEDDGFAVNVMQALSTAMPEEGYSPETINRAKRVVERLIAGCLPPDVEDARRTCRELAQLLFMAFDGFAIGHHIAPAGACTYVTIVVVCWLILR
jgi:AcrR family transcriptional regulator